MKAHSERPEPRAQGGASVEARILAAQTALEGIRSGFNADGADLLVRDGVGTRAGVDLVFTDETCLDCIVPHGILKAIVEGALRESLPDLTAVEVLDPRATR